MLRVALRVTAAAVLVAGCSSGTTTSTSPTTTVRDAGAYRSFHQSYFVPWVGSPDFANLTHTLKVEAAVNGGTMSRYTVDTGSVGMVVPAAEVPDIPAGSPSGQLTYSSSGLQLTGVWARLPVTFPQAVNQSGTPMAAQATVPVLAVTDAKCVGKGVNSGRCTGNIPHMLGVGFGRGTTAQNSPAYNPLLNLTEMAAGTMRRGYLIARGGLSLGLTDANVVGAWAMQPLVNAGAPADGTHNDWLTPAGSFRIGSGPTVTGKALIDTGLLNMIVEDGGLPSSGTVPDGTDVTITVGSVTYTFKVGDGGPQTPTRVNYAAPKHGTFVNTGLRTLGRYDLLFDADGGYLGLRPQ